MTARTAWPEVALAVAAGAIGACQVGKAAIALPALRADLGMGLAAAGWVLSAFNLVGVLGGMAAGALVGRGGDRRTLLLGLAVIALAGGAGAAAPDEAALLATRFGEGLGFLLVAIAAPTFIARLARPEDMRFAFGLWGAYMPTGTAAMMLAAPLVLEPYGWRGLWLANAALVALFAVVLAAATRRLPAPRRQARAELWRDMLRTARAPGPLLLAGIFGCYALQYLAVMGFLPTILLEGEGLSAGRAGLLGALAIAMNALGNVAGGAVLQAGLARWQVIAAATLAMGAAGLGIFLAPLPLTPRYVLYLAFSLSGGMLPAAVLGAAPAHAPAPHLLATTNGLLVQGSNLGQVIGPPLVGALAAASGNWRWSPLVVTTAAVAALALCAALRRREQSTSP